MKTYTLPNGIKIVHQYMPGVAVSHCGLILKFGSRNEKENEHGIAHLIEHCLFKGTEKRKAYHILSRLDAVGGELNAYTTKEELCVYASFINQYYERAIELICDITFHSTFLDKEIDKEKEVITDEIHSYADNPSETLFEDFETILYPNHALGRTILGTEKSVKKFSRKDIQRFLKRMLDTSQIVFSSVGNIPHNKFEKLIQKYLVVIPKISSNEKLNTVSKFKQDNVELKKDLVQAHCIMGLPSYPLKNEKRKVLVLLANILGGSGMNNRLNLNIREKYGYTYSIESNYQSFIDTGNFNIYFSSETKHFDKIMKLIKKELNILKSKEIGATQLSLAKKQLKGHIAIGHDNNSNLMLSIGKSMLYFDEVESIEDVYDKIDNVSAETLLEVANEMLDIDQFSSLSFIPKK